MLFMPTVGCALRAISRGSTAKAKSRGDRGQPLRVPCDKEKRDDILAFVWIIAYRLR